MEIIETNENQKTKNLDNPKSEGVIKFKYHMINETSSETIKNYDDIEFYRRLLYPTKVVGFDEKEQVGYGNLSKRVKDLEFIITASQTGHIPELVTKHYVHVTKCDLENMSIEAIGLMDPSSEALTHYVIYEAKPDINHVFHGHHEALWNYMIENNYPSIPEDIEYGTLAMANAVRELVKTTDQNIFVMKGHHAGFVSFAEDGRKASRAIKKLLKLISE